MNLVIRSVADKGILEKERLVLHAEADVDIGKFILFRTAYIREGEVSGNVKDTLWLPDIQVDAGNLVVIYSKRGENKSRVNKDQSKTHFVYWGLGSPVWGSDHDCPVIVELSDWSMKKV